MTMRISDHWDYVARTVVSGILFGLCFLMVWTRQTVVAATCAGVAAGAVWNFLVEIVGNRIGTPKGPNDG